MKITMIKPQRQHKQKMILFTVFFVYFMFLLHGLPLMVDDNKFHAVQFDNASSFLQYILNFGNGRLLGNGGVILLLRRPALGNAIRALILTAIVMLLPYILRLEGYFSWCSTMFLLLTISPGMFGQTYSWMSGFQNYVPPVLLFLSEIALIERASHGNTVSRIVRLIIVFLCGICMQLYIEHSSCINLFFAAISVLSLWKNRKNERRRSSGTKRFSIWHSLSAWLFFLGAFAGFAVMVVLPMRTGGVLRQRGINYLSGGMKDLLYGLIRNGIILIGMYSENAVALLCVAAEQVFLLWKARDLYSRRERIVLTGILLGGSGVFLFTLLFGDQPWYGKLEAAKSALLAVTSLCFAAAWIYSSVRIIRRTDSSVQRSALRLFLAALVAVVPLLFVWPVGYRCLFHSYVFLTACTLVLANECLRQIKQEAIRCMWEKIVAVLLLMVMLCQGAVFTDIRRLCAIREEYVSEAVAAGEETIDYFTIPGAFIHDYWGEAEKSIIYKDKKVTLRLLPADVWLRIHYYHYS